MQGAFVRSTTLQFWHGAGTTGGTIKVVLIDSQGQFLDWVGESFSTLAEVLAMDVTDLVAAGLAAAMTEQQDGDTNPTGVYVKATSALSFITEGSYTAIALDSTSIASDRCIQQMYWDGTYWTPNTASDANIQALIDLVQATLTIDADPDRTWVMRRHPDRVGSEKVIAKKASENVLLFADVSRLLGENEVIGAVADIDIDAGAATASSIAKIGDIIYFVLSGGSAGSTIDVEISFDTNRTAADEPIECNGYLKVIE